MCGFILLFERLWNVLQANAVWTQIYTLKLRKALMLMITTEEHRHHFSCAAAVCVYTNQRGGHVLCMQPVGADVQLTIHYRKLISELFFHTGYVIKYYTVP